ncbi:hypothetical protein [Yeosuana marina]|uniref:toxin-antitoxin system YwqK family antitoxin n=1 Tax=Yeosuana marina TaxID=1565536 RepID=UPI0030C7AC6A
MRTKLLHIICFLFLFSSCKNNIQQEINSANENLFLDNGILMYNKKPFNGSLFTYFSENHLESRIQYKEGKKDGYEKHWYENGDLSILRFYNNGLKTGIHKGWWENGNLKFEYYFNNKGEYNGSVKEWYSSGIHCRAFNYIDGQENGRQQLWKIDGSIKANYVVVNGERFGLIGLKKCYAVTINKKEIK